MVSVLDAIGDLQSKGERYSKTLGGMYGHLLPDVPEGLNYAYFTAEMGHPEPAFAWRSKFHDLLYKVNRNHPCRTLKANPGKFTGPFHWKNRHFTTAELKRLQTFPDDYEIVGSSGHVMEQIGNSVPPKLAEVIATSIKEQIIKPKKVITYKVRPEGFQSTFRKRQREKSKEFKKIAQKSIKSKYGDIKHYANNELIKPSTEKYYSAFRDMFVREKYDNKPSAHENVMAWVITDSSRHVRLDADSLVLNKKSCMNLEIKISGLSKYLPNFDTLSANASVNDDSYLFYIWKEIEISLVSRSNFFTLIDIYGHYANRGDVVDISVNIRGGNRVLLKDLMNYFGQTENCGNFILEKELLNLFGSTKKELTNTINRMREMRFDIRTYDTHPIIGSGNILCTYPFPLLSKKALVMSKVKLNRVK